MNSVAFQWLDPCPSERLKIAQEHLLASVSSFGLKGDLYPAGPKLVKFSEILRFARRNAGGRSFVWCNSDVTLTADPYELDDGETVRGFHRREMPSGEYCGGVDMYLIPSRVWDEVFVLDLPDLWCGATHIDWWLTRAAVLKSRYTAHFGFIDHVSHETSSFSKGRSNSLYRHNVVEYNKWARRNSASLFERRIALPLIGESLMPNTDYWSIPLRKSKLVKS